MEALDLVAHRRIETFGCVSVAPDISDVMYSRKSDSSLEAPDGGTSAGDSTGVLNPF